MILFAAHAPDEIPAWYEPPPLTPPRALSIDQAIERSALASVLNDTQRNELRNWLFDGPFDLEAGPMADAGAQCSRMLLEAKDAYEDWLRTRQSFRYFAWRRHYAEQMVKLMEQP